MSAPSTPFDAVSTTSFATPEEEFDPAQRTPAFRPTQDLRDLEETPLEMEESEILQLLSSYFQEAENARETGFEARHAVWEDNLHAFWMRKGFDDKLDWQSQEVSAFVPNFVERFAAVHRQALTQNSDWAEITDRRDQTGELGRFATSLTRLALDFAGTNSSGQAIAFEHDFGNMVLTGALMMMMVSITFDHRNGRVVAEQVDPRQCYFDPTGRGLYRVRFWEVDKETLLRQAEIVGEDGEPLYDAEVIEELVAHHDQEVKTNREASSGEGQELSSPRTPILLKEWLVDLVDQGSGKKVREKQLIVVANDRFIIRGPEPNPWWHGKDWIVAHPILQAPLRSPAGRTYVELFRNAVSTFENVTNRILDILSTSSANAFEVNPDLLDDPESVAAGIAPNQTIMRSEDAPPGEPAIRSVEMGRQVSADLIRVWQALRGEAQEAGSQSDISLGQTSRGETTATEVIESRQGQSSLNNSISTDIDIGFLGPVAELVYYTALQHVNEDSHGIWDGLKPEHQRMLLAQRQEFRDRPIVVKARGLSRAVERQRRIRGLLGALNVIGGNPVLIEQFLKDMSVQKLIRLMLEDFGVPIEKIELSEEEQFQRAEAERQARANAIRNQPPPGAEGGSPPAAGGGVPPTAQNQNGTDPLASGVPEGLPGGVL